MAHELPREASLSRKLQVGCPVNSLLEEEVGWKLSLGYGLQQRAVLLEGGEGGVCVFLHGGKGSVGRGGGVQGYRFLSLLQEQSVVALARVVCVL